MGITFRSGDYLRYVYCGGRTIKDGEAVALWDRNGVHTQLIGPHRIWLWFTTIRFLDRFTAGADEYLSIRHRNGQHEIVAGPATIYKNPALHDNVAVAKALELATQNDAVVVVSYTTAKTTTNKSLDETMEEPTSGKDSYGTVQSQSPQGASYRRHVVTGPQLYVPEANETFHEFRWSSLHPDLTQSSDTCRETIGPFVVLRLHQPKIWKCRVMLSTMDGTALFATLVLTYSVVSADRAIVTNDPFPKMETALRADIRQVGFDIDNIEPDDDQHDRNNTNGNDSHDTKKQVVAQLEKLSSFPELTKAADTVGFRFDTTVRVLELDYSDLVKEQVEKQRISTIKVENEKAIKKQRLELQQMDFVAKQEQIKQDADLKRQQAEADAGAAVEDHERRVEAANRELILVKKNLEMEKLRSDQDDASALTFLEGLKGVGVDVSAFMQTVGGIDMVRNNMTGQTGTLKKVLHEPTTTAK